MSKTSCHQPIIRAIVVQCTAAIPATYHCGMLPPTLYFYVNSVIIIDRFFHGGGSGLESIGQHGLELFGSLFGCFDTISATFYYSNLIGVINMYENMVKKIQKILEIQFNEKFIFKNLLCPQLGFKIAFIQRNQKKKNHTINAIK